MQMELVQRGMCFLSLHNWCDTTQYLQKKLKRSEHLAYLKILRGDREIKKGLKILF